MRRSDRLLEDSGQRHLGPEFHLARRDRRRILRLGRIRTNLLNVIATADHITPPCQSVSIMSKVGSTDKEVFRIAGGHIGIMAGSQARKQTWPRIDS